MGPMEVIAGGLSDDKRRKRERNLPAMRRLGERLERIRRRADLSQEELGRRLSPPVSGGQISEWENAAHEPGGTWVVQILSVCAAAMGRSGLVALQDLLEDDGEDIAGEDIP